MYAKSFASSWPLSMQGGSWVDAFPMETAPHRPRSLRPYSDRAATFILRPSHRKALRLVPPTSKRLERTHHNKHVLCRTTSVARSGPRPAANVPHISEAFPTDISTPSARKQQPPIRLVGRAIDTHVLEWIRAQLLQQESRAITDHREKINVEVSKMLMLVVCPSSIDLFD